MFSPSAPKLKSPGSQYRERRPSVGSVTSRSASMMLDLPLLFSPTRTVNPGWKTTVVSRHERKLFKSRRLRYTPTSTAPRTAVYTHSSPPVRALPLLASSAEGCAGKQRPDLGKRREVVTQSQQSIPESGQIHSTTHSAQRSDLDVRLFAHTPRGRGRCGSRCGSARTTNSRWSTPVSGVAERSPAPSRAPRGTHAQEAPRPELSPATGK